jgi:gamma-glutamyltranspeptidase/glutathione hydrolase
MRSTPKVLPLAALAIAVSSPVSASPGSRPWRGGAVAADHSAASDAGVEILELGGNAVDAAVATSFCLSVVRPYSCGIGGGGFMLIYLRQADANSRAIAIDYRERAPQAITPYHFEQLGDSLASQFTGHAVCVPGTVAGLLHALERYGTMDRGAVLAPAIRAAEAGFAVDRHYLQAAGELLPWFTADPVRRSRHRFVWERFLKAGKIAEGDSIRLPEQAQALKLIAEQGIKAFYGGPLGEAIVEAVAAAGGVMAAGDLSAYEPVSTQPLAGDFHGFKLLTMPPPSSGGVATLEVLKILERYEASGGIRIETLGHNRAAYVHLVAEAMKHAFADRAEWFGDADFVDVPLDELLDDGYLRGLAARIHPDRTQLATAYGSIAPPPDDGGTSHFCVIDQHGNGVSCTETINLHFGSRIAVDRFGFVLNNEMDDFTTVRRQPNAFNLMQSERNLPAPGKRPLSSMSPTILLSDDGRVKLMAGGSGGPRIITGVLQVILNAVVFGMPADQAVASPRFHHQWWPDRLDLEPAPEKGSAGPLAPIESELRAKGHEVGTAKDVAAIQLILGLDGGYDGASDPRKGGRPAGR